MELKWILQIVGVLLGLLYLYLEYRADIRLWIVGLIMPVVHGSLYLQAGLYADSAMQLYYILAGLYGLWVWRRGGSGHGVKNEKGEGLPISHTPAVVWMQLGVFYVAIHAAIYVLLTAFTDSNVPGWDSLTTALCIIAYWMLSRKYVEQWLVWLLLDAITVGLYLYKGIPLTACLYGLYTCLAWAGYRRWLRQISKA